MVRRRSFWAWGYEDKFPSAEALDTLAKRLTELFGEVLIKGVPPTLDALRMPEPRFDPPLELKAFGTTDRLERALHTYGKGYPDLVRAFGGDFFSAPDWVFYPSEESQLVALFRFCEKESIALVPFGGGTSVVGGVEHANGGRFRGTASVDLTRFDKVLEVDTKSRSARVQGGANGPAIAAQLAPHGFTFRHYPQSFEFSTLGGWIATRSAGHFATLYTRIDDFVESVRMVSPAGVIETRRSPASGAGPSPERLVLGSEGALGIITEAWIRVQPRPRWRASAAVRFASFDAAVASTRILAQSGLHPSSCRLLDAAESALHDISKDGSSVLLVVFESADHPVEQWMERALSIATDLGGACEEEPHYTSEIVHSIIVPTNGDDSSTALPAVEYDAGVWRHAFFEAPYRQSALVSLGALCDTFDTACTWTDFPKLHEAVTHVVTAAMKKACGAGVLSCRFTHVYPDGPAPSYTFLAPARPGGELEQWETIKTAASEAILANGGTVTHHTAVGRVHRPFWERERSPLFEDVLTAAKNRLDPAGILNPGCLLPARK